MEQLQALINNPKVALYTRLSRDDAREGESLSIENQKTFLINYATEQGYTDYSIYVDDGYSGLSFDRPDMNRLLNDVKNGDIDIIIAKDLSRIGRNHAKFSEIVDEFLPEYNCTLIAVNDGVNTAHSDNDIMPFKNLFNEFYSRDLSRKIRTSKLASAQKGKYSMSFAPMGYIKNPLNTTELLIDENSVHIVRNLFELRLKGLSYRRIASILNENNVITPKAYQYQLKNEPTKGMKYKHWSDIAVARILSNETYIGTVVSMKKTRISYKNKKTRDVPTENWIRVPNMHEPIIDIGTWEAVQRLADKKAQFTKTSTGEPSLFCGLLVCETCGSSLKQSKVIKNKGKSDEKVYVRYICSKHSRSGNSACSSHSITENNLIDIIKKDLEIFTNEINIDEQKFIDKMVKLKNKNASAEVKRLTTEINALENRLIEIEKLMQNLYEDKILGDVPKEMYTKFMKKYEIERSEKENLKNNLKSRLSENQTPTIDVKNFVNIFCQFLHLNELNRPLLLQLIDKIEIFESETVEGTKEKQQKINVYYNFLGKL